MPVVRREPLPSDEQAYLDYRSKILIIDESIADSDLARFEAEAILCLNGRRDLAAHVEPHRPYLLAIPGGRVESAVG